MTRLFIRHGLAAAWMAETYGVRFQVRTSGDRLTDVSPAEIMTTTLRGADFPAPGYFVHPESEHVFAPRDGDTVRFANEKIGLWRRGREIKKILQRNGVAFHWPEQLP